MVATLMENGPVGQPVAVLREGKKVAGAMIKMLITV